MKKQTLKVMLLLVLIAGAFNNCAKVLTPEHESGTFVLSSYNPPQFKSTLQPLLVKNCGYCHGYIQEPVFAGDNEEEAIKTLITNGLVDLDDPANSYVVTQIAGGHSGIPTSLASKLQTAIAAWSTGPTAAP